MDVLRVLRRWFSGLEVAAPSVGIAAGERHLPPPRPAARPFPLPQIESVAGLYRVLDGPLSDAEALRALHRNPGFLAILDADNRIIWSAGMGLVPRASAIADALDHVRRTLAPIEFQTVIDHVTHNVVAYPWFDAERRRHTVLQGAPWFPAARVEPDADKRVAAIATAACEAAALVGEPPLGRCASCAERGVCWVHARREAATTTG